MRSGWQKGSWPVEMGLPVLAPLLAMGRVHKARSVNQMSEGFTHLDSTSTIAMLPVTSPGRPGARP